MYVPNKPLGFPIFTPTDSQIPFEVTARQSVEKTVSETFKEKALQEAALIFP